MSELAHMNCFTALHLVMKCFAVNSGERDDALMTRSNVCMVMPCLCCSKTCLSRACSSGFSCPSGPAQFAFLLLFSITRMGLTSAACCCCHFTKRECATWSRLAALCLCKETLLLHNTLCQCKEAKLVACIVMYTHLL
jgi:hypothetical protein